MIKLELKIKELYIGSIVNFRGRTAYIKAIDGNGTIKIEQDKESIETEISKIAPKLLSSEVLVQLGFVEASNSFFFKLEESKIKITFQNRMLPFVHFEYKYKRDNKTYYTISYSVHQLQSFMFVMFGTDLEFKEKKS